MWANYEVRSHPKGWAIVHIRSGYIAEVYRSRAKAAEIAARFNSQP